MKEYNWVNHVEMLVIFLTLIGGFYSIDAKFDAHTSRTDQLMLAWHEESKDFHGRLCSIEERNKK